MRTRLVNHKRILESLDATLRDLEIRACWVGLSVNNLTYATKIDFISLSERIDEMILSFVNASI